MGQNSSGRYVHRVVFTLGSRLMIIVLSLSHSSEQWGITESLKTVFHDWSNLISVISWNYNACLKPEVNASKLHNSPVSGLSHSTPTIHKPWNNIFSWTVIVRLTAFLLVGSILVTSWPMLLRSNTNTNATHSVPLLRLLVCFQEWTWHSYCHLKGFPLIVQLQI